MKYEQWKRQDIIYCRYSYGYRGTYTQDQTDRRTKQNRAALCSRGNIGRTSAVLWDNNCWILHGTGSAGGITPSRRLLFIYIYYYNIEQLIYRSSVSRTRTIHREKFPFGDKSAFVHMYETRKRLSSAAILVRD